MNERKKDTWFWGQTSAFPFTFFFFKELHSISLNLALLNVEVYTGNYTWICLSRILRAKRMPFFPGHTMYCVSRYLGNLVLIFIKMTKLYNFLFAMTVGVLLGGNWIWFIKLTWKNCMKALEIGKGSAVSAPWATLTTTEQICSDLALKVRVQLMMDLCKDCLLTFSHR